MSPDYPGFREGYNRMITLFIYLNNVTEGGTTVFPYAGMRSSSVAAFLFFRVVLFSGSFLILFVFCVKAINL